MLGKVSKFALVSFLLALAAGVPVQAEEAVAVLSTFDEVPALIGVGRGSFHAEIANDLSQVSYTLSYERTGSPVTQAHIHIGQPGVNGAVTVFLCTNLGNAPAAPPCPAGSGSVSGTFTALDIGAGAAGQGVGAGELDQVIRAMRQGSAYVNVHSADYPAGVVRGLILVSGRR